MKDNRTIKEKIVGWIVMLQADDFRGTDAEMVRDEMLELIDIGQASCSTERICVKCGKDCENIWAEVCFKPINKHLFLVDEEGVK